jgi:PTH1 family peptidyl-tRNA hydrolase
VKLIVGLGNRGDKYAKTRHNLGFMIVDQLASRHALTYSQQDKLQAAVAKGLISGQEVVLAKAATMMNLSGRSVQRLAQFYKLKPEDVWLIYDELDLEFGRLRIRDRGSDAGHNGVASVASALGRNFTRWRVGIGKPVHKAETANYVLRQFTKQEQQQLPIIIERIVTLLDEAIKAGEAKASSLNLLL